MDIFIIIIIIWRETRSTWFSFFGEPSLVCLLIFNSLPTHVRRKTTFLKCMYFYAWVTIKHNKILTDYFHIYQPIYAASKLCFNKPRMSRGIMSLLLAVVGFSGWLSMLLFCFIVSNLPQRLSCYDASKHGAEMRDERAIEYWLTS